MVVSVAVVLVVVGGGSALGDSQPLLVASMEVFATIWPVKFPTAAVVVVAVVVVVVAVVVATLL